MIDRRERDDRMLEQLALADAALTRFEDEAVPLSEGSCFTEEIVDVAKNVHTTIKLLIWAAEMMRNVQEQGREAERTHP